MPVMHFQPPRPKNHDERILPLVNVVFLLLVFFMLAGRLAVTDPFPVDPPESNSETTPPVGKVVVLVGADGRLAVDGDVVAETALADIVADRLDAGGEVPVELKADANTDANRVIAVMEDLRDAGVSKLRLLTVATR